MENNYFERILRTCGVVYLLENFCRLSRQEVREEMVKLLRYYVSEDGLKLALMGYIELPEGLEEGVKRLLLYYAHGHDNAAILPKEDVEELLSEYMKEPCGLDREDRLRYDIEFETLQ